MTGAGSSTAWDGLTSYIEVDSSAAGETITIGNGTVPGSLVTVIKKGSANEILVDATTDFDSDQGSITLSEDGEMCTLFWNDVSWRVFNQAENWFSALAFYCSFGLACRESWHWKLDFEMW